MKKLKIFLLLIVGGAFGLAYAQPCTTTLEITKKGWESAPTNAQRFILRANPYAPALTIKNGERGIKYLSGSKNCLGGVALYGNFVDKDGNILATWSTRVINNSKKPVNLAFPRDFKQS